MSKIIKRKVGNFEMYLNPHDHGISGVLAKKGEREKAFMSVMRRTIKEGMTCIDLGANIGYTVLNILELCGDGQVYAIEPDPRNYKLLKKNIKLNNHSNCELNNCAISDEDGKIKFWMASTPNTSSVYKTNRSQKEIDVDAFAFDSFLSTRKFPNFIKMDVEGHEVSILRSGLNYFKQNDGEVNILMEVHPTFYSEENNMAEVMQAYFDNGFRAKYVVASPVPIPDLFKEAGYEPTEVIKTDGFKRGIYDNISNDDAINFSCYTHKQSFNKDGRTKVSEKIVRSILIARD